MTNWLEEYSQTGDNAAGKMMNHRSIEKTALVNEAILRMVAWKTTDAVLDVGCGDASLLASLPPVRSRMGVVPSDEEIDALVRMHQGSDIEFAQGLSTRLPFPDRQFDVLICNSVFLLLDIASAYDSLLEFYRVARPGAVVFIGETPVPISLKERLKWWLRRGKRRSVAGLFAANPTVMKQMCLEVGFVDVEATPSLPRYRMDYLMRK